MKPYLFTPILFAFCSLSLLSQTAPPPSIGVPDSVDVNLLQSLLVAKRQRLTFSVDDVITVQIYGIQTYAEKQRVGDDGAIVFPLIGKIQVAGLTNNELQAAITNALATLGMIEHAQVSVLTDSRPSEVVSVLGDVVKPGVFPAAGNLTIADYLSEASGFVESVSGAPSTSSPANYTVTLVRPSLSAPVRIPLGPREGATWGRIPVFAGDKIRVDKTGLVYAVGAFKMQGSYQLKNTEPTTVTQLVALAGGVGYEAAADSHIVRKDHGKTVVLDLNVGKILKGESPDVALLSDDILFVPTNKLKAAIKGGGPSIIVSLASAALFAR